MPRGGTHAPRVRWNPEELWKLAEASVDLMKNSGYTPVKAVNTAQKTVLPKNRHRFINTLGSIATVLPVIKKVQQGQRPPATVAKVVTPPPAPVVEVAPPPVPLPQVGEVREAPTPVTFLVPADMIAKAKAAVIAEGGKMVEAILTEGISRLLASGYLYSLFDQLTAPKTPEAPPPEPPAPPPEPEQPVKLPRHNGEMRSEVKDRPPTVLILGLKGYQQPPVQASVAGKLNVKFWGGSRDNENKNSLREKAKYADYAILSVDGVGHDAVEVLQSVGVKLLRTDGSSSGIIRVLKGLIPDQPQA